MKNMEHEFSHIITRTSNWKWKVESGLPLTIIEWCPFITYTRKFEVPDQLTADNRETKTDLQLSSLPFGLVT